MKLIGIVVGAALLTAAPFSLHWTPRNAGLYVDHADARVVYRRGYRRSCYGYGYNSAGCPPLVWIWLSKLLITDIRPIPVTGIAHTRSGVGGGETDPPPGAPRYLRRTQRDGLGGEYCTTS
jgi:hypothetical protein